MWIFQSAAVWFLAAAWWNAILSVFPIETGGGMVYLWLAVLTAGLVLLHQKTGGWTVLLVLALTGVLVWIRRDVFTEYIESISRNIAGMISPENGEEAAAWHMSGLFTRLNGEVGAGLTASVLSVPFLEIWIMVLKTGKGKLAAGVTAAVPFFCSAAAGYFPPEIPAWLLVLAACVYFAAGTAGGENSKHFLSQWGRCMIAAAVLCGAVVLAAGAGKLLDSGRDVPGSFYQEARSTIRAGVIERIRESASGRDAEPEQTENTDPGAEEADEADRQVRNSGDTQEEPTDTGREQLLGEEQLPSGSGMEDLRSLSAFVPEEGIGETVTLDELPESTVYLPERYGIVYSGGAWSDMEDMQENADEILENCREYPEGLERLEDLCSGWDVSSYENVGERIDSELSARAVYDTNPGTTPSDQDFVEYFLFERGRGFCVHFASASVLLYRMCGYPARYAEGYAVPASAFSENGNGGYTARIDGSMGHAWCQVYDSRTGNWIDADHTPAAPRSQFREEPGGADKSETGEQLQNTALWRVLTVIVICATVLIVLSAVTAAQAAVRRKYLRKRFEETGNGRGILAMYESILRTARYQGTETGDIFDAHTAEILECAYPEISGREWKWIYEKVLESMFYHLADEKAAAGEMKVLYKRFVESAEVRMSRGQRLIMKYIRCCAV